MPSRRDLAAVAARRLRALAAPGDPAADGEGGSGATGDDVVGLPSAASAASAGGVGAAGRIRVDPGWRGVGALAAVALAAAVATGLVAVRSRPRVEPIAPVVESAPPARVVVHVAGRVRRPGLIELPVGARVADAVRAAGGVLPGAPTDGVNLARRVVDGEQIVVGVPAAADGGKGRPDAGGRLDLNAATLEQLDALPGVGPVLARRILDWRSAHGRFASVEQLRDVRGIGARIFESLRELVTV